MNNNIWIDKEYTRKISSRLRNYKEKSSYPFKANFACPYCGDSKKNPNKTRGWINEYNGSLSFKCWNCGKYIPSFSTFLKNLDYNLYNQYKFDIFKETHEDNDSNDEKFITKTKFDHNPLDEINSLTGLDYDHLAVQYFLNRKIPKKYMYLFYYTNDFFSWIKKYSKNNEFDNIKNDSRLVIPFFNEEGKIFAVSARSLNEKNNLRYLTIKFDDSEQKIYGLERVDFDKKIYVTEGNIDSLFLPNSIAFAGADGNLSKKFDKNKIVIIYDNEPRNKEICNRYKKAINENYNIVIWPSYLKKFGKDINEYILHGISSDKLKEIIDKNTYSGLMAITKFNQWKK